MAKYKKILCVFVMVLLMAVLFSTTAFAAGTGDVAGAIESTWTDAADQIKAVVNNVVFPVIDLIWPYSFLQNLGWPILTIGSTASLNGPHRPSCLPASFSP